MSNFKEIIILGYGEGKGLEVDEEGFVSSRDIEIIGRKYGNNTPVNRLIQRKSVLMNILTTYFIELCDDKFPPRGEIALEYIELLRRNNVYMDDNSERKHILTRQYIEEILKEYDKGNSEYSGSRLLEDLPGFVRKHNRGGLIGQVVYYNRIVSLILASVYDYQLQYKIFTYYNRHMVISDDELKLRRNNAAIGSKLNVKIKNIIYVVFKDQNDRDRIMSWINTEIRKTIGRTFDLGEHYVDKDYPIEYSSFRILCEEKILDALISIPNDTRAIEKELMIKGVVIQALTPLRLYNDKGLTILIYKVSCFINKIKEYRIKHFL